MSFVRACVCMYVYENIAYVVGMEVTHLCDLVHLPHAQYLVNLCENKTQKLEFR